MSSVSDGVKVCSRCNLPKSRDDFHKRSLSKDGLMSYCKECNRSIGKRYRAENRDECLERQRNYRAANLEKCRESVRKSQAANMDKKKARDKAWREANPDKVKAYAARSYRKHLQKRREAKRLWWQRNKDYNAQHMREYRRRRPEVFKAILARRRARIASSAVHFTSRDVMSQFKEQRGRCHWCHKKLGDAIYHVDHRVPLAKGGGNGPENIVISCAACNHCKQARMPWDFNGRLL